MGNFTNHCFFLWAFQHLLHMQECKYIVKLVLPGQYKDVNETFTESFNNSKKKKRNKQQNVRSGQSLCMHSLLNLIDNLHDEMEMFHI